MDECINSRCHDEPLTKRYCVNHCSVSQVLEWAFDAGKQVELKPSEDYGFHIVIDGTVISGGSLDDSGFPWETFEYPIQGLIRNGAEKQFFVELQQNAGAEDDMNNG